MNWEQTYSSFGNPNAQPPTPTQTPTSATFPSPLLQTPRAKEGFEDRSGWMPNFVEDHSVFNATQGCLTSAYLSPFEQTTPRPSTSSSTKIPSNAEELAAELASHANHIVGTTLSLPPVDPSCQLSSSPGGKGGLGQFEHRSTRSSRPKSSKRRVDDTVGGQTATPPGSATKLGKSASNTDTSPTMQRDEDALSIFDTPGPQHMLNFPNTIDMSAYPLSAPATAPAFTNMRPFWDPEANMSGMNLDFSGANVSQLGEAISHRPSNSFDWGRENQMFQQNNNHSFDLEFQQGNRQDRYPVSRGQAQPMTSASTGLSFGFGGLMSDDPFSMATNNGAVDPGLLFTMPGDCSASFPCTGAYREAQLRPATGHQQDRSQDHDILREQGLRRSRSMKENTNQYNKQSFSSPAKSTRPSLQRSMSDSRTRRQPGQKLGQPAGTTKLNSRAPSRSGRVSPLKQLSRPNLASIPESTPPIRTAVTFSIDANGRARTETTRIMDKANIASGVLTHHHHQDHHHQTDGYESSHSESSSDGELIVIPSRTSSSSLQEHFKEPSLGQFDTAYRSTKGRRQSNSGSGHLSRSSSSQLDEESEAETVVIGTSSGDATEALKRVMGGRKKAAVGFNNNQRSSVPRYRHQYASSTNSPTTMTDPDLGTPSTDRESSFSDSTRCVCGRRDGDIFMIQCESCEKWLHGLCVGINRQKLPKVYICAFCAQTPNMRGGRIREATRSSGMAYTESSPLAHKAFQSWRR